MERVEAEAIYDRGRDAVVEVLLALSAQNERLEGQVERLTARVDKLERELAKELAQLVAAAQHRPARQSVAARKGSVGAQAGRPAGS